MAAEVAVESVQVDFQLLECLGPGLVLRANSLRARRWLAGKFPQSDFYLDDIQRAAQIVRELMEAGFTIVGE